MNRSVDAPLGDDALNRIYAIVRKAYPEARKFEPLDDNDTKEMIGFTFAVPGILPFLYTYGWASLKGDVAPELTRYRVRAGDMGRRLIE